MAEIWSNLLFLFFLRHSLPKEYGPYIIIPGRHQAYLMASGENYKYKFNVEVYDNLADVFFASKSQYAEFLVLQAIPSDVKRVWYDVQNLTTSKQPFDINERLVFFNPLSSTGEFTLYYKVVLQDSSSWWDKFWWIIIILIVILLIVIFLFYFCVLPRVVNCWVPKEKNRYSVWNCDCLWDCFKGKFFVAKYDEGEGKSLLDHGILDREVIHEK